MAVMPYDTGNSTKRAIVGIAFGCALFLAYSHNVPNGYELRVNASDVMGWVRAVGDFGDRVWTKAPRMAKDGPRMVTAASVSVQSESWAYSVPEWTGKETEPPRDDVTVESGPSAGQSVDTAEGMQVKEPELIRPVVGPLAAGFGIRNHPIEKSVKLHKGIDIAGNEGDPVMAALSGTVTFAGSAGTLGNAVIMQHDDGRVTKYGHMSKVTVKQGQRVEAGQRVGLVGHTGEATGPHLHFEYWVKGSPVDPIGYFPAQRNGM